MSDQDRLDITKLQDRLSVLEQQMRKAQGKCKRRTWLGSCRLCVRGVFADSRLKQP